MTIYLPIFIIVLAFFAIFFRVDFVLVFVYLFTGVYIVGRLWGNRVLKNVMVKRDFLHYAFFGEKIPVILSFINSGLLPVIWMQFQESFPLELITNQRNIREVISLKPKETASYHYILEGRKRGIFPIGPLFFSSGDIFGIAKQETRQVEPQYVVVYPKIVPLSRIKIPSQIPMGTLRYHQPVFEDPTRIRGKRDYVSGDSLRRVDWKASAVSGKLQVKLFEPSIALETAIFLNLNSQEYDYRSRIASTELAIIVAASISSWLVMSRQSVGLYTNGLETIIEDKLIADEATVMSSLPFRQPVSLPPKRGRPHLIRILETLAKVQVSETYPIAQLLRKETPHLPWGTSLLLITSNFDDELFDTIFQASRSGIRFFLIPCGPLKDSYEIKKKAEQWGYPFQHIYSEEDLKIWKN